MNKGIDVNTSSSTKPRNGFLQFLSTLWSIVTWTRIAVLNVIFLLLLIIFIIAINAGSQPPLPASFALRLAPSGVLVDQRSYVDPTSMLLNNESPQDSETVVRDLVDAIAFAAEDTRVTSIVLELDALLGGGLSKMQEIGAALDHFKSKGKKIIAVGDNYSQDQYYLASYADQIYLHDMGSVLLTGYGRYGSYYKSAIDKLAINYHVFRSGKYKDAVEPYLRDDMSEESKTHNAELLHQLWDSYTRTVENHRDLSAGAINDYINNLDQKLALAKGDSAGLAAELGLVDDLVNRQKIRRRLIKAFGKSPYSDDYNGVDARDYLAQMKRFELPGSQKIGLLVASGTIVDGIQPDGVIGSESVVEMLRSVAQDDSIKALVLRVDSGGGSAFASEIIRAEMAAVRKAGKPVFISMGSVAASGGYWIAMGANEVWATPTTITGSIGVFGAFPTLEKTLENIGINNDGVGTTDMADSMRLDRPLSPKVSSVIQLGVDNVYQRFIHLVAAERKMEPDAIDQVAQGHVWSGAAAKELGLIDQLGNLNDVIAAAAAQVNLTDYSVELIEQPLSPQEALLRQFLNDNASTLAPRSYLREFSSLNALQEIAPILKPLAELHRMNDPQSIYASCTNCMVP
jgi:protease-4